MEKILKYRIREIFIQVQLRKYFVFNNKSFFYLYVFLSNSD